MMEKWIPRLLVLIGAIFLTAATNWAVTVGVGFMMLGLVTWEERK